MKLVNKMMAVMMVMSATSAFAITDHQTTGESGIRCLDCEKRAQSERDQKAAALQESLKDQNNSKSSAAEHAPAPAKKH